MPSPSGICDKLVEPRAAPFEHSQESSFSQRQVSALRRSKTPWRHLAVGGLRHPPKPCYNSSPLLRPWFAGACRELKTPWPKASAGAEAIFIGVFERGPATSPLAHSGVAAGLVESSRWAANLAVVLWRGRLCRVSFHCIPCDFFGDDRCAAGEFSGGDRCMAGARPPAHCLYKGVVGGGVPPPRIAHSLSLRSRKRSLPSSLSPLAALARFVFLFASRA